MDKESQSNGEKNNDVLLSDEKQTLMLLNKILIQTKEFSTDKRLNFEELGDEFDGLEKAQKSLELYHDFKNFLLGSNHTGKFENYIKDDILDPVFHQIKLDLPQRLRQYRPKFQKYLRKEEKFTHKIIDTYLKLNNPREGVDPWSEFSKLDSITGKFLKDIKKDEEQ